MFGQKKIIEELKKRLIMHGYPSDFKWTPMLVEERVDQIYMERTGKMPEDLYNEVIEEAFDKYNEIYNRIILFPEYKLSEDEINSLGFGKELQTHLLTDNGIVDEDFLMEMDYYEDFEKCMKKAGKWGKRKERTLSEEEIKNIGLFEDYQKYLKVKELRIVKDIEVREYIDKAGEDIKAEEVDDIAKKIYGLSDEIIEELKSKGFYESHIKHIKFQGIAIEKAKENFEKEIKRLGLYEEYNNFLEELEKGEWVEKEWDDFDFYIEILFIEKVKQKTKEWFKTVCKDAREKYADNYFEHPFW